MAIITIEVNEEIKTAFECATPDTQQQLRTIIQLFFRNNLQTKILNNNNKNEPDPLLV